MHSNSTKSRIGVNFVSNIVETNWASGWQEYAAHNDDAIDGVILMRKGHKRPTDTGGVVFAQIKCGGDGYRRDQKQYPEHLCINLGKPYIVAHMERWKRVPGPVVLIFVDDTTKPTVKAWWVNLRDNCISPSNPGIILIPKTQRFGHHTKGSFHKLCGPGSSDRQLATVTLSNANQLPVRLGKHESLRNDAWGFYKQWRSDTEASNHKEIGPIAINRVGWKHMTRLGRHTDRIINSWLLLSAAREMVRQDLPSIYLGHAKVYSLPSGATKIIDYLGIRSNIVFPHRHKSVVQIVFKRQRIIDTNCGQGEKQIVWFYSVFEPRRGMNMEQ